MKGTLLKMEFMLIFWSHFLLSCMSEGTLPLYEDEKVKVFPVVLAKDAMQIKPGIVVLIHEGGKAARQQYVFY